MGSISGQVEARCKECQCRFVDSVDNWIFVDEEVRGTCNNCFNRKNHDCIDEFQEVDGRFVVIGKKEFQKESAEPVKEAEKFFVCGECGDLTTWSSILEECEKSGSNGMCYCSFTQIVWNNDIDNFDVDTLREFVEYTEISESISKELAKVNDKGARLKMFRVVPTEKRMIDLKHPVEEEISC